MTSGGTEPSFLSRRYAILLCSLLQLNAEYNDSILTNAASRLHALVKLLL